MHQLGYRFTLIRIEWKEKFPTLKINIEILTIKAVARFIKKKKKKAVASHRLKTVQTPTDQ